MRYILILILVFTCIYAVNSKYVTGMTRLSPLETEQYIGRFSFSSKLDGSITGDIRVNIDNDKHQLNFYDVSRHTLGMYLFDDTQWKEYNRLLKKGSLCTERMKVATYKYPIHTKRSRSAMGEPLKFSHFVRQQKYVLDLYLVISDCLLEEYNVNPPEIMYNVTFLNGYSHLPQDERYIPLLLSFTLIILIAAVGCFFYLLHREYNRYHQRHLTQVLLGASFVCQLVAVSSQLLHLYVYSLDGQGLKLRYTWFAFDFLSEITQLFSELILAFILICLSLGWTLTDTFHMGTLLQKRYLTLMGIFSCIHIYLQYKGRVYEEDFNYFHDFSHWPGFTLMALRLLLFAIFLIGMAFSYGYVPSFILKITPLRRFFQRLGALSRDNQARGFNDVNDLDLLQLASYLFIIGMIWFVSFPCGVTLSFLVQPSMRRLIVVSVGLLCHISVLLSLMYAFLVNSSLYHQKSTLNSLGTIFSATRNHSKTAID